MSRPNTSSSEYYRNRAICQKIFREGTGLAVDRMSSKDLRLKVERHAFLLRSYMEEQQISNPALARAVWEIDAAVGELVTRGTQLVLPIEQG